ncbi:MAG TPA: DUF1588 domain-containing protein [Polyangiaceae bacterium]|jgi:hypothetical protein|nr:DUF1588 domain-containing protein [Polyangiaceae bacterium]
MGTTPELRLLLALPLLAALTSCIGKLEGSGAGQPTSSGGPRAPGAGAAGSGGVALPPDTQPAALLPTRIRRLTNAEFENSVKDVVGNTDPVTTGFVPDTRQSGFTLNDAQRIDSVLIKQISGAATILASQVRAQLDTLAPCADPTTQGEACATSFIQSFATRAYRRPLGADEVAQLVVLYHAGADAAAYADGIQEVATGVLQSAAFLYLTETGNAATGATVALTPYEIASEMSYILTAGPPSQSLIDAATSGDLATPAGRSSAIDSLGLLTGGAARDRVVRVMREWLGTDQLEDTAKDTTVYPDFAGLKPAMVAETTDFIVDLVALGQGNRTVQELLGADWTSTEDPNLLGLYEASSTRNAQNHYTLQTRRGILNQGAFLSVYAHANETGPVLRGVALLRRVTCIGVPSPASLNITVVPLVPDPTKTTRQRLTAHVTDPVCAQCHTSIDNFGLAFEIYDGMGKHQTEDQGQPIDSSVTIAQNSDFDGNYADSNQLALALSTSTSVRECFARNIFRGSAGNSDTDNQMSEDDFIKFWNTQTNAATKGASFAGDGDIIDTIRAYITSPTFNIRRGQ